MITKDSAVYRGLKTALQVFAALIVFAAADPNVRSLITDWYPQVVVILPILGGAISVIQNVLDKDVPNI